MPLLDVHDSTRAGRRREQVGLSAEESRDLQYIHHLSCQSRLCRFVHIAEHGYTDSLAHGARRAARHQGQARGSCILRCGLPCQSLP